MSHNTIGKQAGYDGTNVEFIAKNLVCETLNGTAVPSGGLSQTLDEVCTGGTNNVTVRQVIANGLVSSNGRIFCQQQPLPTITQLSNIVTLANGELKTQTLTKEVVLPDGLESVCNIKNTTNTALIGNSVQSTSNMTAATTIQAGTALQVTTKPTTIPAVANQEVLVWDNNVIKAIDLETSQTIPTLQQVTSNGNNKTTNDIIVYSATLNAAVGANLFYQTDTNGLPGTSYIVMLQDTFTTTLNKSLIRVDDNVGGLVTFPTEADEPNLPPGVLYRDTTANNVIKMKV
jgi:hypothetical protein